MFGYIYKTTNLCNNKIYIGQHKGQIFDPYYYGSGTLFQRAFKKEGKENFKCEILEECETAKILNEREIYWIEYYQSRNPEIGYNLAKGGEQVVIGCTEYEIEKISKLICNSTVENIYDVITEAKKYGLRIYKKGEGWSPTSNNSNGEKMVAKDDSIIISFYIKNQLSTTKKYAEEFNCNYWKYNLMVELDKIPKLIKKIKIDYIEKRIIAENSGVGRGTTGIFLESQKQKKSARMALSLK